MSIIDAQHNSPDQNVPDQGCPLIVAVGENETNEFKNPTRAELDGDHVADLARVDALRGRGRGSLGRAAGVG